MEDQAALQRTLNRACRALQILEEEKASYGIRVPVDLQIDLEEKQKEITGLEVRLSQFQEKDLVNVPNNLSCYKVPRHNDVFVGREKEIARCLEALSPDERGWGVTINGIGGMGKTVLALEVAHLARKRAMFDAYLYASAKTTRLSANGVQPENFPFHSFDSLCQKLAEALEPPVDIVKTTATERRNALLNALRGRRTLLICDSLEILNPKERNMIADFMRWLPDYNKAIITSRHRTGESAVTIRLDGLSKAEVLKLIKEKGQANTHLARKLNAAKPETLTALYEVTGGNPLALDWTLGQVAYKGCSISVALERLRNATDSYDIYQFLFADTAQILTKNDCTVLSKLAVFPAPAKTAVLADAMGLPPKEIQDSLERLVILSLVDDSDEEEFDLHPLTRTYIQAALLLGKNRVFTLND